MECLEQATVFTDKRPFEATIEDMFLTADADNNGTLDPKEFMKVNCLLRRLM